MTAMAETGITELGHDELQDIFTEIILANSNRPGSDLRVANFSSQPSSIMIPAGKIDYRLKNQIHPGHLGRKSISLVLLVDGKEEGKMRMSGDLHLYDNVVCADRDLARNTVLSANDLQIESRDISGWRQNFLIDPEEAVGKQLKNPLKAGTVLLDRFLIAPVLVKRGDQVVILAQSDRFRITALGEAKTAGSKGEMIRVKNLMSRKLLLAKVKDSGLVEVRF
jgi:flagella basal body P-ring formation protein FlgA